MSARLARPPASLLPLTSVQLVIVRKIAYGETTEAIATELSLAISSVNVQVTLCGRKLGASGRAVVVHAAFATDQHPRPERAPAPENVSDEHIEAWRMVAIGATSRDYARRAGISRGEALRRVPAVRAFAGAVNDPHLVTLGWTYGLLDESLDEMATGHRLRTLKHSGQGRRRNRHPDAYAAADNDPQVALSNPVPHRIPARPPSSAPRTRRPLLTEAW